MNAAGAPPPTSIIGRDELIRELAGLMTGGLHRLVTLTGPGGVGKTRLAIATAESAGAPVAHLATVRTVDELWPALAAALKAETMPGETPRHTVLRALGESDRIIVLDNVEQIPGVDAAIAELGLSCPSLRVLVTSRMRLGVPGEHEVPVPPLTLPNPDETESSAISKRAAVALFVKRAQIANPAFRLHDGNAGDVASICRRLDGLPLAIELAAARCGVLAPDQLRTRLETGLALLAGAGADSGTPERQRTIRAAIGWSYDLLSADERLVFRALGIFSGGCPIDALETVLPGHVRPHALAIVDELVRHGLARLEADANGDPRIAMLETVHAVGAALIDEAGELTAIRAAHVAWLAVFAADAGPRLQADARTQLFWWNRIAAELANVRAAADGLAEQGNIAGALTITADLNWFWTEYTLVPEGIRRLTELLARADPGLEPRIRARALNVLAMLFDILGEADQGTRAAEAALAIWQTIGDERAAALAHYTLAGSAFERDEMELTRRHAEEARARFVALGDRWHEAAALVLLGGVHSTLDHDYDAALACYRAALDGFRSVGDGGRINGAICAIALLELLRGNLQAAADTYAAALEIETARSSDRVYGGWIFAGYGLLAEALGDERLGVRLCSAADACALQTGFAPRAFTRKQIEARIAVMRGRMGEPAFAAAWHAGRGLSFEEAVALCRSVPPPAGQPAAPRLAALSKREREVLALLAHGRTDAEIADALFIARRTASQHVSAILAKLGVTTRAAAAGLAARHGFG